MAILHVATETAAEVAGGSSIVMSSNTPANANNTLFMCLSVNSSATPGATSVTDGETTWTQRGTFDILTYNGGDNTVDIWSAPAASTTSRATTVSMSGANYGRAVIIEFSGVGATPTFQDGSDSATNTTTDASVTGVTASADADNLCLGVLAIYQDTNANITVPTGYTRASVNQDAQSNMGQDVVYKINTTAQAESVVWTHDDVNTAGDGWVAGLLVIGDGDGDGGGGSTAYTSMALTGAGA